MPERAAVDCDVVQSVFGEALADFAAILERQPIVGDVISQRIVIAQWRAESHGLNARSRGAGGPAHTPSAGFALVARIFFVPE